MWAISQSYVLRWKQKWMWRTGAGDSAGSWLRSDEQSTEAEQSKAIRLKAISCWKAVSVIATERSVPRFAYKPVSVLLFYIWVQTPSVIVSINFSKMELKIKDNKFVSVNSGKGKKNKQTTFCGHHRLVLQNPVSTGITSDSMTDCYQQTLSRLLPSGFWRNVTGGYPVCQR